MVLLLPPKQEIRMADETYVRNGLAPYGLRLRQVADEAYADWVGSTGHSQYIYQRTKANARFDHVARHVYKEFSEDKDIKIIGEYETFKLVFCNGTIVLRFKHEGKDGLGVNGWQTQPVLEFINAELPTLPGIPPQHHVECCFKENALDTALDSVTITARHMYTKTWSYDLPKATAEIVPFTLPAAAQEQKPVEVRPRQTEADKSKESDKDSND
jgi:hypothetical protein